uniref:Uncharacterized protein n=1 Tax=Rangifer tarandus platyrhynchus TaxID=3082113 RepID=A0ACB0F4D4_RANTA|nr:unnamed protein product [Rangifer tarandus platyrhynchus]
MHSEPADLVQTSRLESGGLPFKKWAHRASNSKSEADSNERLGVGGLSAQVFETAGPAEAQSRLWTEGFLHVLPRGGAPFLVDLELTRLSTSLKPCVSLPGSTRLFLQLPSSAPPAGCAVTPNTRQQRMLAGQTGPREPLGAPGAGSALQAGRSSRPGTGPVEVITLVASCSHLHDGFLRTHRGEKT